MLSHFKIRLSDIEETGLLLVTVTDARTNFKITTALPNHNKATASIIAYAGARYSRSSLSVEELFKEINTGDKSADEKLANIFRNYGHASVADMANLFAYIEGLPVCYAFKFFYETSVGAGQERSSRYQDFSNSTIIGLKDLISESNEDLPRLDYLFRGLQSFALEHNKKWIQILTSKFIQYYKINLGNKQEMNALKSRVFDSARAFLPNGMCYRTSKCYITSAREWSRLIAFFKGGSDYYLQCLGEQLEFIFAPSDNIIRELGYLPEAAELIRHTQPDTTIAENLNVLQKYLQSLPSFSEIKTVNNKGAQPANVKLLSIEDPGLLVILQNILTLYPSMDEEQLSNWLSDLPIHQKEILSKIVFHKFNHHNQMGNQFKTNSLTFVLDLSIAEARDLVRHRSVGRFIPSLSSDNYLDILRGGFILPMYISENPEFEDIKEEFSADLNQYYLLIDNFVRQTQELPWFPQELYLQILPFAHSIKMWMHASPKEIDYLTKLRVRPGGHINYRVAAYDMAQLARESHPFLTGMMSDITQRPDPLSKAEFIDRS